MDDFSTNSHSIVDLKPTKGIEIAPSVAPARHPFSFNDGNIAIQTGAWYFTIHEGLLSRHSSVFKQLAKSLDTTNAEYLGGCPVLRLPEPAEDWLNLLKAFYDGYFLTSSISDFPALQGLLILCTKYKIQRLREMVIATLVEVWPKTLRQWEAREARATNAGVYAPRLSIAHPILVINLAREMEAPELLPAAMYDLSRTNASESSSYTEAESGITHQLSNEDLLSLLRGREHTSRFLSTFIVNDLESRAASEHCLNALEQDNQPNKRACIVAYEAVTFELLRDSPGIFCNRNADPLYAIAESDLIQSRGRMVQDGMLGACEACRAQFSGVVENARQEFWAKIPAWFNVNVPQWD